MTDQITFQNAPLIEIIAELRWLPLGAPPPPQGQPHILLGNSDPDPFAMTFGRQPDIVRSFTLHEKLVPAGFPAMWHQVVWRFRKPAEPSVLLQVGPGVFSANALQPYRRWSEFRPIVEQGVTALLASRPPTERNQPFTGVTLRYVNHFGAYLTEGKPSREFLRGVLGFDLIAPKPLTDLGAASPSTNVHFTLLIPMANTNKTMSVQVGNATIEQFGVPADGILLNWNVAENLPVPAVCADVMAAFDASHDIIHDTFVLMTEKIHDRMKPEAST